MAVRTIILDKYTLELHDDGRVTALRYGEPWPGRHELSGDKLLLAMAERLLELQAQLAATQTPCSQPT